MKIAKAFRNKIFSAEVGQHKRFSFGHVESSLLKLAEKISAKTLTICFQCPKKLPIKFILEKIDFPLKVAWQVKCSFDKSTGIFPAKIRDLSKNYPKTFGFIDFWLTAFHILFLFTRRTLFSKSAKKFWGKSE